MYIKLPRRWDRCAAQGERLQDVRVLRARGLPDLRRRELRARGGPGRDGGAALQGSAGDRDPGWKRGDHAGSGDAPGEALALF